MSSSSGRRPRRRPGEVEIKRETSVHKLGNKPAEVDSKCVKSVQESRKKAAEVELKVEQSVQKSMSKVDEVGPKCSKSVHTFVEDSQLERKCEKDREKSVRETARVEENEKLDKKRSTLDWTPK